MQEFLHMGGYAFYVWSSFGLVAVVLAVNAVLPLRDMRRLQHEIRVGLAQTADRGDARETES